MQQGQQPPQPAQDGQQAGRGMGKQMGGQQGGVYPADKNEVSQFINDLMRGLYSEGQQQSLMEALSRGKNDMGTTLGQLAGALVMSVVQRRQQENGRKPHINLVVQGLRKVISELVEIVKVGKIGQVTEEDLQKASAVAGSVVEQTMGGGQEQQQQGQQSQQPQVQQQQRQQPQVQQPQGMKPGGM